MSLYRTWRPTTFDDLVGQETVVKTLRSALRSGKLAHAYLFSGPRGSGKTSAAKILSRCVNCVLGPTDAPDNTCENCQAILAGTALDVLEIDAASYRGIDEIRTLRDAVKFAPAAMRMKVYIIDEAHMITGPAANAFLKTLEEPPPYALFILATTEPEKLPITILSRCQRYAFRRISIPVMIERMRVIAKAEKIAIDDAALAAIAYRADGGLRDALTMLEQAAAFSDGTITPATVDLAFGSSGRDVAATLMDCILARDAAGVLQTIDEASDAGTDMQVMTRALIGEFRNLLVARIDPKLLAGEVAPEDAQRAVERAKNVPQAVIVRAARLLSEALAAARSSGNPRLELETALLRFTLAAEDPTLDAISARVAQLEQHQPTAASPQTAAQTVPAAAVAAPTAPAPHVAKEKAKPSAALTIQKVRAAWQSIRTKIESERQSLRGELARAMPESIEGNVLTVKVPKPYSAEVLRDNLPLMERAVEEALGAKIRVLVKADPNAAAAKMAAETADPDDPDELFSYLNERIK